MLMNRLPEADWNKNNTESKETNRHRCSDKISDVISAEQKEYQQSSTNMSFGSAQASRSAASSSKFRRMSRRRWKKFSWNFSKILSLWWTSFQHKDHSRKQPTDKRCSNGKALRLRQPYFIPVGLQNTRIWGSSPAGMYWMKLQRYQWQYCDSRVVEAAAVKVFGQNEVINLLESRSH